MRRQAGFTLMEVLLSMAIISILVGLSMPFYESFVRRNDLGLATQTVSAMLRRAETYAPPTATPTGAWRCKAPR